MTLHIPLTPETEAKLRERAAKVGKGPVEFAREALEEKLAATPDAPPEEDAPLPVNQRAAELLDWVASHRPVGHAVDDSRESIYEGRGE